ncbi:thiamine phosphate synthase [Piscinibacterium candidicorallinum]|uniref:Thiamine-phosphate synthase n=1 Tax=Piscinibacterium candidicorallinum TaxID=1793872 RepID=A0ABV7HBI7_9BURK
MTDRQPTRRIQGLYAITPDGLPAADILLRTGSVLRGGARVVQLRSKHIEGAARLALASALRQLTGEHGALLIINDDVTLALQCEADGVHLGRDDGDLAAARAQLGPARLLGASCYDQLALAQAAVAAGADHVAFGSLFDSPTKPAAVRTPLSLFNAAAPLGVPRVGIGGVDLDTAPRAIAAGADALAVISALYYAPDPEDAARAFSALFAA